MKISDGFMLRNILDSWIVVPVGKNSADNASMLSLSESSAHLWKLLEKGATKEELTEALVARYDIGEDIAKKDVGIFIEELEKEKMLNLS